MVAILDLTMPTNDIRLKMCLVQFSTSQMYI